MNYHFTKKEYLKSILQNGLIPFLGGNSDLVNDKNKKISYSKGANGIIGMTAFFQGRYDLANLKEIDLDKILGEGVYLAFDEKNIENLSKPFSNGQEDIFDASTKQNIPSEKLKVCLVYNKKTEEYSYKRADFLKYMMSKTDMKDVLKTMPEADFTDDGNISYYYNDGRKITRYSLIENYYGKNKEIIEKFKSDDYAMATMDLGMFMSTLYHDKCNMKYTNFSENLKEKRKSIEKPIIKKEKNITPNIENDYER